MDEDEFEDDGYGEDDETNEAYGEPDYLTEDDFDDKDSTIRLSFIMKKVRIFHGKNKKCAAAGLKRLLAFLLSALCMLGVLPLSASFAMEPGQTASSWLGDQYAVGSDGQHYYSPRPIPIWSTIPMGLWTVRTSSGGSAYRHYMLTVSDGTSHQVYCGGERDSLQYL